MGKVVKPQIPAWLQKPTDDRDWYRIERNAADGRATVYIYDEIGMWGTSAGDFAKELRDITESSIDLHVNSPGGDVFDGIAIFNAIKNHPADVTAFVDGLAASAASFITQAADKVVVQPHARIMIHDAHIMKMDFGVYNSESLKAAIAEDEKLVERLDASSDNIASMYAERAGGTADEWRQRMRDESWFTDQEAVDAGLADEVGRPGDRDAEKEAAKFDLAALYQHVPERLVALHREIAKADVEPFTDEEITALRALLKPAEAPGDGEPQGSEDTGAEPTSVIEARKRDIDAYLKSIGV